MPASISMTTAGDPPVETVQDQLPLSLDDLIPGKVLGRNLLIEVVVGQTEADAL